MYILKAYEKQLKQTVIVTAEYSLVELIRCANKLSPKVFDGLEVWEAVPGRICVNDDAWIACRDNTIKDGWSTWLIFGNIPAEAASILKNVIPEKL